VLAAVSACLALASAAVAEPTSQRRDELARLVRQDCGSCHGLTLQGGLGKALLPESLAPLTAEQIADVILEGMAGTPMPPWKSLLQRDEALWIAARLKEGFPP
jgi:cytochrome c55X